ncbi:hypothetical protein G9A89_000684 [Geosiphon pyriformis]|nr:hypothetical protein G9A89_000684 [Geosiphon pyriformis]
MCDRRLDGNCSGGGNQIWDPPNPNHWDPKPTLPQAHPKMGKYSLRGLTRDDEWGAGGGQTIMKEGGGNKSWEMGAPQSSNKETSNRGKTQSA